jgi:hypothetical protein
MIKEKRALNAEPEKRSDLFPISFQDCTPLLYGTSYVPNRFGGLGVEAPQ